MSCLTILPEVSAINISISAYNGHIYLLPYFVLSGTGGQSALPKWVDAKRMCFPSFKKKGQVVLPVPVLIFFGTKDSFAEVGNLPK